VWRGRAVGGTPVRHGEAPGMGMVERLRKLDDRVGLAAAPARWQVGDADPPRWARQVAAHRFGTALALGGAAAICLAALWTLGDHGFPLSNLVARWLLLVPVTFLVSAVATASIADRVDLVVRVRRLERRDVQQVRHVEGEPAQRDAVVTDTVVTETVVTDVDGTERVDDR
jgi:hypothetical protein